MEFRARVAGFGNREGEGVILLHGFPETSIMWEPLLDKLAKAGFRAVAFDQRGYSPGARPFRVNSYSSGKPGSRRNRRRLSASIDSTSSAMTSAAPSPGLPRIAFHERY
jgi:pimeloyl-ACP methyl ester carboxylesterase